MGVSHLQGDLLDLARRGRFDVVVHGCNCSCVMGAGIALGVRNRFPEAYRADLATRRGDRSKLGTCTQARCSTPAGVITVVNAYTQYEFRGPGVRVDYDAVRSCFAWVARTYARCRIGLPRIGAGLARGEWSRIERILLDEMGDLEVTVVTLPAHAA